MEALFLSMVNRSIAAGYLVLAVLVLRLVLKKAPRWINCALWLLVAVRLVWPFSIVSPMSLIPSPEPLPPDILYTATPVIQSGINAVDQAVNPVLAASMTASPMASANPTQIWSFLLSRVWVAGVVVMLLCAVVSVLRVRRSVRAAVPLRDNLMICDGLGSPFILGVFRPMVYLPSELDDSKLAHIIAHENAHLSRRDHWWKPLGYGLLSVFWFHPLLWVAYILLCRDIEYACDQRVIRDMEPAARKSYSTTLLECSLPRYRIAACPLAFGEVGVKQRIRSIANYRRPAFWVVLIGILACIVAAVCFLTDPAEIADPMSQPTLTAQIQQINGDSMLVSPTNDPEELIWVPMKNLEPSPEPKVGDYVKITYDGLIAETFPAQLNNPYHIQVVSRRSTDATGYEELLHTYKTALEEQWTPEEISAAGLNPFLSGNNPPDHYGYLLIDQDGDGVNELLVGELHNNLIYAMYTLRNGKPVPIIQLEAQSAEQWSAYRLLPGNQYYYFNTMDSAKAVAALYEYESGNLVFREARVITETAEGSTLYYKTTDETLNPDHFVTCLAEEATDFIARLKLYQDPDFIPFGEAEPIYHEAPQEVFIAEVKRVTEDYLDVITQYNPNQVIRVARKNMVAAIEPRPGDGLEITYSLPLEQDYPDRIQHPISLCHLPRLTIHDIVEVVKRNGEHLTWADFSGFYHFTGDSGFVYPMDGDCTLTLKGYDDVFPSDAMLYGPPGEIDIRYDSLTDFLTYYIREYTSPADMIPQLFDVIASSLESSSPEDYLNARPDEVKALLSYGDETLEYVIVQFLEGNKVGLEGHLYRYFLDELAPSEAIQGNWLTGQDYFSSWFSTAMRASYNYTPEELEQRCPAYALAVKLSTDPNPPRARSYDD